MKVKNDDIINKIELHKLTIGERIKYYRMRKGYGQTELAKLTGIPLVTLKKYEKSNKLPKTEPLSSLASALDCSVYDLMNLECDSEEDVLAIISQPNVLKFFHGAVLKLQKNLDDEINYYSSLVNELKCEKKNVINIELNEEK